MPVQNCLRFVFLCRFLNNPPGSFLTEVSICTNVLFKCLKQLYFPERWPLLFFDFFIPLLSDLDPNPGTGIVLHSVSAKAKIYGSCGLWFRFRLTFHNMISYSIFNVFLVDVFERNVKNLWHQDTANLMSRDRYRSNSIPNLWHFGTDPDPWIRTLDLRIPDLDHAPVVSDCQDANKN